MVEADMIYVRYTNALLRYNPDYPLAGGFWPLAKWGLLDSSIFTFIVESSTKLIRSSEAFSCLLFQPRLELDSNLTLFSSEEKTAHIKV